MLSAAGLAPALAQGAGTVGQAQINAAVLPIDVSNAVLPIDLRDAVLPLEVQHTHGATLQIANYYVGFVKFTRPADLPDVDVSAQRGSGIRTVVGAVLPDLSVGQVVTSKTRLLMRDGDVNQEDTTNTAIRVWTGMRCFRFSLTDHPQVNHFALPADPNVLRQLIAAAARPRSH
jgi:hypothetical protein